MMVYNIAHAYKVAFPIYVTKITYIIRLMINITFINKHTKYIKKKHQKDNKKECTEDNNKFSFVHNLCNVIT